MHDIREVSSLAETLKKSVKDTEKALTELGVSTISGYYDHARYTAAFNEPSWLRERRNEWTLSHDKGLGAAKYVLDALDIDIVQHDLAVPQRLMLQTRNKRGRNKRSLVKLYYRNKWIKRDYNVSNAVNFIATNFLNTDAQAYLFLCVEGKTAWAYSTEMLQVYFDELREQPFPQYVDSVICREVDKEHPNGSLHFWLNEESDSLLTHATQLCL